MRKLVRPAVLAAAGAVLALTSAAVAHSGPVQAAAPVRPAGASADPYQAASALLARASMDQLAAGLHGSPSAAPVVVVSGLNNPRQLAMTADGSLLVAESGHGGDLCVPLANGGETCLGRTGSVSWVPFPYRQQNMAPIRVVSGLLSGAGRNGSGASGPHGVSGRSLFDFYVPMVNTPPVPLPAGLDPTGYGQLLRTRLLGQPEIVGDLAGYERANDPDGQGFESNPYAVLALRDRVLVADAAGNDVLEWRDGRLRTFALFPNFQDGICAGRTNQNGTTGCDPVPTGLAAGPDGSIYVSTLGAVGPGASRIYQLDGRTGRVKRVITGLSSVIGVAVGPDGSVYASQLYTAFGSTGPDLMSGKVVRIRPNGQRTEYAVPLPSGLAVSGHHLYVSAFSIAPATGLGIPNVNSSGQIWRLQV